MAETSQVKGLPAVSPVAGQLTVTTSGWPPMVTLALALALAPAPSVTVKDSVNDPLTASVRLIVPVPVYGVVPPVAVTVQSKGLPAVRPEVGQDAVTMSGWAATVTVAEPEAD